MGGAGRIDLGKNDRVHPVKCVENGDAFRASGNGNHVVGGGDIKSNIRRFGSRNYAGLRDSTVEGIRSREDFRAV